MTEMMMTSMLRTMVTMSRTTAMRLMATSFLTMNGSMTAQATDEPWMDCIDNVLEFGGDNTENEGRMEVV